jgi:photosystem II stability/assembly factor-like uncharacterized protein
VEPDSAPEDWSKDMKMPNLKRCVGVTVSALAILLAMAAPGAAAATRWFALVDTGELFVSSDQGAIWSVHATLPVRDAVAMAAGTTSHDFYLACRSGSLYRSSDDGISWNGVSALPASDVVDLLVQDDLSLLVLSGTGSLFRSLDQGAHFAPVVNIAASDCVALTRAAPTGPHYVLTRTGTVYRSDDGGATWSVVGTFPVPNAVRLRAVGSTLYAISGTGAIYRSQDNGVSFLSIGTLSQVGSSALTVDDGTLIAGTLSGEVATSPTGESWTWRGAVNQLRMTALATDIPASSGVPAGRPQTSLVMSRPWPNPARRTEGVSVTVDLHQRETVTQELFDVAGRLRASRSAVVHGAGAQILAWQPTEIPPGVYSLRVRTQSGLSASAAWVRVP